MLVPARGRLMWNFKQEQSVYISYWKDNVIFWTYYLQRRLPSPLRVMPKDHTCGGPWCVQWTVIPEPEADTFLEHVHQAPMAPQSVLTVWRKSTSAVIWALMFSHLFFTQTPILFESWDLRKYPTERFCVPILLVTCINHTEHSANPRQ